MTYKKSSTLLILLLTLTAGCGGFFHNPSPINTLKVKIRRDAIHIPTFILQKKINWYGERNRNWVTFHKVTPLYNYFYKSLVARLRIKSRTKTDYNYTAKKAGIKMEQSKHHILHKGGVLFKKSYKFYRLARELKAKPNSHFVSIELLPEMNKRDHKESNARITTILQIRNRNGSVVYTKVLVRQKQLTTDEYLILFSYRGRTREKIARKAHHVLTELFVLTTEDLIRELGKIIR